MSDYAPVVKRFGRMASLAMVALGGCGGVTTAATVPTSTTSAALGWDPSVISGPHSMPSRITGGAMVAASKLTVCTPSQVKQSIHVTRSPSGTSGTAFTFTTTLTNTAATPCGVGVLYTCFL